MDKQTLALKCPHLPALSAEAILNLKNILNPRKQTSSQEVQHDALL